MKHILPHFFGNCSNLGLVYEFFFCVSNENFFSTKNVLIVVYMGIGHAYLDTDL
jgi:hypothetical protein